MIRKNVLQKNAASFGDTRKMLEYAKNNNISIIRTPKEYGNINAKNYFSSLRRKSINPSAFDFTDPIAKPEKKYFRKAINHFSSDAKNSGPFFSRDENIIYLPRKKDFNYRKNNPTDVFAHELGHSIDMKPGFKGWLRHQKYNSNYLNKVEGERRANTEAIKNFISPENKLEFSYNIKNFGGFKSYTEPIKNFLIGRSYRDIKGKKYKDWVKDKKDFAEGSSELGKKMKNFLTMPFESNYDPLQKKATLYSIYGEEPTDKKKRNSNIEKLSKKNKQLNSVEAANKDMLSSVTQGLPILQSSTIY